MPDRVPFYSLEPQHNQIRDEILKSIERVFDRQHFVLGTSLRDFERSYAGFIGTTYCAGVASGLDAITLSLRALGIKEGDEVIVPSHTFIATWLAVSTVGGTIVPVESRLDTYNIDCGGIEAAITGRTKAIIPVHLYGQSCDMQTLMQIAAAHQLLVVEDNAQAHGSKFNGKMTGSFGHCNATSLYPTKNLGSLGDAGAITTNDEQIFDRIASLRNYGAAGRSTFTAIGVNSRMDELQAAVLQVKLGFLKTWNEARASIAKTYIDSLQGVGDLQLPVTAVGCTHVYHRFVVRTSRRDAMADYLLNKGVETLIHYPVPPHLQHAYSFMGYKKGSLPIAEEISATCISLPLWPGMTKGQIEFVIDSIRSFWK